MRVPRLHVVTNDEVLGDPAFADGAAAIMDRAGAAVAVHLRSPEGRVRRLLELADALAGTSRETGAPLLVNDRPDVALAAELSGVQLGRRSVPVQAARSLLGDDALIGSSVHGAAEAASALENGADFVLLGTIWDTASHPGREGAGPERVREAAAVAAGPIIAIGGVTPERSCRAIDAGAWGVAAIRGVWHADDPTAAVMEYLDAMGVALE